MVGRGETDVRINKRSIGEFLEGPGLKEEFEVEVGGGERK